MCDETNWDEETEMITTKRWGSRNDLALNWKSYVFTCSSLCSFCADYVIKAVTNLQTRSNQRGNNEESDRADLESITDEVNAQFQIPRQGSRGWRTATSTTSTLCQLLLSIPRRTRLFNRPDGVLEGEQETLHQLQESNNQTSCIKIFACFPIPNMIRCHEELRRQIWSSLVSTWTHWSYTRPCVKLAFMWNWRPCSKKPWAALVLMTLGKQLTFYCCVLSTQQEGLLRRHWHSLYYFLVWMHMPLCLNPPSTRPWQAFGVAWRISLTFTFHVHHQWCH